MRVATNWLNDKVINASLWQMAQGTEWFPYNSFFWRKHAHSGPNNIDRWFRKHGNIAARPRFVIPTNEGGDHWTVFFVDLSKKTMTYYNSLTYSIADADRYFDALMNYLERESRGVGGKPAFSFTRKGWTRYMERLPQQQDGYNCGVMVYMRIRQQLHGIRMGVASLVRVEIEQVLRGAKTAWT